MRPTKVDYWQTNWGKMLRDPTIEDEESKVGKKFRLRFRLPYMVFSQHLVPLVKNANIFPVKFDKMVRVPLEFKILMALRILARGNVVDDIEELSSGYASSILTIFHQF